MEIIAEHSSKIKVKLPSGDVSRKLPIFYNPLMTSNRNLSVLLLNSLSKKEMRIALPLAGSGIRALRFLKELTKGKIKEIYVNDIKDNFVQVFKDNLELNNIRSKNIFIYSQDASLFLLKQENYFDYLDLDPFGSPNPFLAAAIARVPREGILAVTATDTAALTGTYLKATQRKYWGSSLKNYLMHETGLRILIRKVQLQGIQFDKALIPVLAYYKNHYFRIYFVFSKGKEDCGQIIKQHQYLLYCSKCLNFKTSPFNKERCDCGKEFNFAGPLWRGNLFDKKLVQKMHRDNPFPEERKFLELLEQEKDIFGFYDLHQIAKVYGFRSPRLEPLLKRLNASRTHFSPYGFKTEKGIREITAEIKKNRKKDSFCTAFPQQRTG